jgi:(4-O-methyl)-D-glucuronate---lignin esterase
MRLAPRQSFFVVFPRSSDGWQPANGQRNFPVARPVAEIGGPWQVAFDPRWGGPKQVDFAVLEDWTRRPDPGIKYYSGTATYWKTFDAPPTTLKAPGALYLDLGKVKNLARVRLNGSDLGTVWCAPWRAEVGGVLKEKDNRLEIEVVNTWVNRIIGAEQQPPDTEMVPMEKGGYKDGVDGRALEDLPDWLIQGRPRPSQRYTFVNWQFYPKDAPLLESGLIGPVRLVAEE